ncbi:hypothetical protein BT96DRAFT_924354 [Gymnopus androsaceus JB14]|uniref:Uncharacterized protein n=1 Tax=Gymnopus androsaceus JB14 TaxID=1447944 RepID=A0A6A4H489_9AGAR|nr:hypothetical protein BT96DRAFT_924354 [Gymnopus androsaceus JB14]
MDSTIPSNPQGLLLVYSDPGGELSENNFNQWYDEEHVPQRLHICTNISRYRAIDSRNPPWVALYHTSSPGIPESKEWLEIINQASDNEKTILEALPILTRAIYMVSSQHDRASSLDPETESPRDAGKVTSIIHLQVTGCSNPLMEAELEASLNHWYQNTIIEGISATPGWLRSKVYKRYSGSDMKTSTELKAVMDCGMLVIHEWDQDGDAMEISKLQANVHANVEIWEKENKCTITREVRLFSLHKEW